MKTLYNDSKDIALFDQLAFDKGGMEKVQPATLRSEQKLVNTSGLYKFNLKDNQSIISKLETRLNPADVFVFNKLALGIYERDSSLNDEGVKDIQFFPNTAHFTANAGFTLAHLMLAFNGTLSLRRGTMTDLSIPTRKFLSKPNSGQAYVEGDANSHGYVLCKETEISGAKDVYFEASFPAILAAQQWAATSANKENILVLLVDGFIIKGGAL